MALKGLDALVEEGSTLLRKSDAMDAHRDFGYWCSHVSKWLNTNFQDSGLSGQWMGLGTSYLVTGRGYTNDDSTWIHFKQVVEERLKWLGILPIQVAKQRASKPEKIQEEALEAGRREIKLNTTSRAFVDPARIEDLKKLDSKEFDFSKLIRLCEELNLCYATECYFSISMLLRAIIDHVPPIFRQKNFDGVANNYGDGGKSFKEQMQYLDKLSKKIADGHLHMQIRKSESLPTARQVDFANAIDCLLAEIVRLLKIQPH